jgi:CheY-like chemotaxis protein
MVEDVKVVSPSLLLLEDDPDVAITIAELLEERGFLVTVAADAAAALEALETGAFSLVLADFLIGKLADSEATALRVLDAAGPTPVGAVTAWNIPETLVGRYAFIRQKPFAIEEFLATVAYFTVPQLEREAVMAVTKRYFVSSRRS